MSRSLRRTSSALYDAVGRFSNRRRALALLFIWALAEATVWPILADFLLAPLAIAHRGRPWRLALAAIGGMAVGGVISVLVASGAPTDAAAILDGLPLTTGAHLADATSALEQHGVAGFLTQPWSGIPFKAWAVAAGQQGLSPAGVIPLFIAARSVRLAAVALVGHLVRRLFADRIRDWFAVLVPLYIVLFTAGWALVVL